MILYKNGLALLNGKLSRVDIAANHGRIIEIVPDIVADDQTETIDCAHKYLLPALVDIHTHGANGYDFNTADADGIKHIMEFYIAHGVGTVFPTLTADNDDALCKQLALIAKLSNDYPEIKGINLEGPFINPKYSGFIPAQCLCKPSMDKFLQYQRAAEGKIKMITVAPELPDALAFIAEVSDSKVVVSLGHSGADGETVIRALKAGAKSFSLWGNDMSQMDAHDLNMTGAAMLSDAYCEVIADGKHVHPDIVKLLVKCKGANKVVGVTDSTFTTGLGDGDYSLCGKNITVSGGEAFVTGTKVRAGGMADAYQELANIVTFCGLPLSQAIKIQTVNPATLVGLNGRIGTIDVGMDADFIIFG